MVAQRGALLVLYSVWKCCSSNDRLHYDWVKSKQFLRTFSTCLHELSPHICQGKAVVNKVNCIWLGEWIWFVHAQCTAKAAMQSEHFHFIADWITHIEIDMLLNSNGMPLWHAIPFPVRRLVWLMPKVAHTNSIGQRARSTNDHFAPYKAFQFNRTVNWKITDNNHDKC